MRARAIVCTGKDQLELREVEVRSPRAGEIALEALYTCISPGTELRCLRGGQPGAKPPFIMGYAFVGRVIAVGDGVTVPLGTTVFCHGTDHAEGVAITWGGHVSHAVIRAGAVRIVPSGVDPLEASLTMLGAIAFHGVRVAKTRPNERVAVVGLGPIGQMAAVMHRLAGANVVACDRSPRRVEIARALGTTAITASGPLTDAYAHVFPGGADLVVDATGAAAVVADAIPLARDLAWGVDNVQGARYLVQGSYAEGFTVPYDPAFLRELTFLLPRSTEPGDESAVLELLARKQVSLRNLIGDVRRPEDAASSFAELAEKEPKLATIAFRWNG
jgi:2-desacetyl-2-hydroxyethyl bacteriochlorophyllide A dehydrogenase